MQQNRERIEMISMEEYLSRRQAIRAREVKKENEKNKQIKSPAAMLAELYV